jgi:putative transposase
MARVARVVAPGVPHHVTQRGNRKQTTFFCEADYMVYKSLMAASCKRHKVDLWSYCLMPNHVHLIAVPENEDSLRKAIGQAHKGYTSFINKRQGWTGRLWQGRFFSYPMDDSHLLFATRYIELNPIRAGLVEQPEDYLWSSAKAHVCGIKDNLVRPSCMEKYIDNWLNFLSKGLDQIALNEIRIHQRSGRPVGSEEFVCALEKKFGRDLRPLRRGRKRKQPALF